MANTQSQPGQPTVVLVHDSFADASSWAGVTKRLEKTGVPVKAISTRWTDRYWRSGTPMAAQSSRTPPPAQRMLSAWSTLRRSPPTKARPSPTSSHRPRTASASRPPWRASTPLAKGPRRSRSTSSIHRSSTRFSAPICPKRSPTCSRCRSDVGRSDSRREERSASVEESLRLGDRRQGRQGDRRGCGPIDGLAHRRGGHRTRRFARHHDLATGRSHRRHPQRAPDGQLTSSVPAGDSNDLRAGRGEHAAVPVAVPVLDFETGIGEPVIEPAAVEEPQAAAVDS